MAKVIKAAIIAVAVVVLTVVAVNALGAAGALGSGFTAIAVGSTAAMTFVGTLVAGGIGMLTNKGISASAGNFGTKVTGLGGATPRQIIYGTARVGGTFVKMDTRGTKNAILSTTIVVAGHPCDGFDEMYFGETKLTFSSATVNGETVYSVTNTKFRNSENDNAFGTDTLARFTFHDGSQTAVDGLAAAGSSSRYPSTAKFLGCTYFYLELVYDPEKMPNIPKIWFVMRGKNIWDPRANSGNGAISTTDAQRQNPALQIRDYLTDTTYGLKALDSELNDGTSGGGFSSAANLCDTLVTLADNSTTERRYTSSGISNFSASGSGLIEAITTSCAGNLTYTNGKFNLFAGASQTAALTITDDKLLAPPRITTQSQSGELFNAVKSIYINKNDNYQASEIGQFTSSAFLAADTPSGEASANFKRVLELRYPFTTSETTAQRLQRISLNHQRQATTVDLITSLEFMKAQPNDWIYLTNERLGYTNKTFEIQNMSMTFLENDGQIFAATSLSLQEIDASVFGFVYNEYSTPQPNAPQSVIGEVDISAPTIGTPVQITNVEGQTAKINIRAVWSNAVDSAIQGTEIQFKASGDSEYQTATLAGKGRINAEISNVKVGLTYNIRVRHFSFDNIYSDYSSVVNITITQPDTITNPTSLAVTTDKPFNIELSWVNPSNTNMRAVDVHYGTTTGYTPSTSNLIGTYYGDIGKKKTVLLGRSHGLAYDQNYYFKIRAVNIYGSFVESGGSPVYVTSPAGQMKKVTTVDVDSISANKLSAGTIDAGVITVNNLNASKITSGELTLTASAASAVKAGKSSFEDATTAGFFLGFTDPDVGSRVEGIYIGTATNGMRYDTAGGLVVSGNISATTGAIGGITIASDKIYVGTGTFNNANTAFYADDTGQFSLKDKLSWNGTTLTINGGGTFSGALSAASGTFTGSLSGGTISIGSSNSIFKADSNGIYLGNATFGSAPFSVNMDGELVATKVTVSGTAPLISIGTNSSDTITLSTASDHRMWVGSSTPESAKFKIHKDGTLTAKGMHLQDGSASAYFGADGFTDLAYSQIATNTQSRVNVFETSGNYNLTGTGLNALKVNLTTSSSLTITVKASNLFSGLSTGSVTGGSAASVADAIADIPDNFTLALQKSTTSGTNGFSDLVTQTFTKVTSGSTSSTTYLVESTAYVPSGTTNFATQAEVNITNYASVSNLNADGDRVLENTSTYATGAVYFRVLLSTTDTSYDSTLNNIMNNWPRVLSIKDNGATGFTVVNDDPNNREITQAAGTGDITSVVAGTNLNGGATSGVATLNLDSTITGNHTFSNNLIVEGNLTVEGTTTTVDTDNLNVKDKNITLNYSTGDSSSSANGAGITIQDAVNSTTNATILWDSTNDEFDFSHKLTAPSLDVGGNITVTGTVDGVDIATRDGILTTTTNTANSANTTANAALPKAGGTLTGTLSSNSNIETTLDMKARILYSSATNNTYLDLGSDSVSADLNASSAVNLLIGGATIFQARSTGVLINSGGLMMGGSLTEVIDASRNLTNIGTYNGLGTMTLGNYTGGEQLQFLANADGTSHIYWRDNNQSEGTYLKAKGETYGGDITFGARWDDDEDKIFFQMRQSSANSSAPDARIGVGIAPTEILHLYEDNSTMGNTTLKVHNNKTDDAAVLWLEGKRTSTNDTAQIIGANNGNIVTNIRTFSGGDNGALKFYTSTSGTGSSVVERFGITDGGNITVGGTTVIDASRNLTNIGTISSGAITSSGKIEATQLDLVGTDNYIAYGSAGTAPSNGDYLRLRDVATGNDALQFYMDSSKLFSIDGQTGNAYHKGTISSGAITSSGAVSGSSIASTAGSITSYGSIKAGQGGVYTNSVERITNAGNLTNIGTINSGAITATGSGTNSAKFTNTSGNGGYVNIKSNVGGVSTDGDVGLHIGWNKSNGGREVNMIFDGGTSQADTEMIFTSTDGTTYTDIFQINGGGNVDIKSGGLRIGTTTVIDASRNITGHKFTQSGSSGSSFYAATFSRSGSGTTTPDIWGSGGTLVLGTSSSVESVGFSGANAQFYGTISSGAITSTGNVSLNQADGFVYLNNQGVGNAGIYVRGITSSSTLRSHSTNNFRWEVTGGQKMELNSSGVLNAVGGYQVNGTTVIDSSRNLENIVNASTSKLTLVASTAANIENYATGTGTPQTNWRMAGASSNLMTLSSSGALTIAGSLTQNSDRRIKDNITPITDALSKTCALQGSTYTRTDEGQDTDKIHAGLIAQDVEAILPEAVGETGEGIKTIDYTGVIALLVQSIKELKSEVDDLKAQLSHKEK